MAVHSGRRSAVNGISTVRNWSVNDQHTPAQGVASNTAYGTLRRKGVHDWTGSFDRFGVVPEVMPGESFSFIGYTAPDDDISGVGMRYSGTACVSQIALNMNWAGGEMISIQHDFAGHLALTGTPGAAEITDSTDPEVYPIGGCKLEYSSDGSTWHEWTDLLQAVWTLSNQLQQYVNSSTYVGGYLWTGRKPGPIDWQLAVTEQNGDRSRFNKGDDIWVRLHLDTSGTNYWQLKVGQVGDFTGIVADRETGKILQQTVNVRMNSNLLADGSLGHILKPDGTAWWGT